MEQLEQIIKLLREELTGSEKAALFQQMEQDEELRELYIEQKNIWVKTGVQSVLQPQEKVADFKLIWSKVAHSPKKVVLGVLKRYAAIAVIALMVGSVVGYLFSGQFIYNTQVANPVFAFSSGERSMSEVELPDGSMLRLNSQSRITFQQDHKTKQRLVTLEGEALFDVVHDETSPFIIDFGKMKIVDVGTVFNVKAYSEEDVIETTLIEGLVDVIVGEKEITNLLPGQKANYSKEAEQVLVTPSSRRLDMAWTKNRFVFQDVPLSTIMKELGEWYEFDVTWKNESQKNMKFHLNVKRSTSIETVMKLLEASGRIKYELVRKEGRLSEIVIK